MKINYIIATWSGRRINWYSDFNYYKTVLKNHITEIKLIKTGIDQITIMRPYNPVFNTYYDVQDDNRIRFIDCENRYQSYGQWLKAVELFMDDFDYFIFIEDDYIPATDNFEQKLINIYEEGSYLCSKISGSEHEMFHCEVSNGFISKKTIENILKTINFRTWFDDFARKNPYYTYQGTNYQVIFSRYLDDNGIKLLDYRKHYLVDFYVHAKIWDYSSPEAINKEYLFSPIQTKYM